jgi:hypothetical protein
MGRETDRGLERTPVAALQRPLRMPSEQCEGKGTRHRQRQPPGMRFEAGGTCGSSALEREGDLRKRVPAGCNRLAQRWLVHRICEREDLLA